LSSGAGEGNAPPLTTRAPVTGVVGGGVGPRVIGGLAAGSAQRVEFAQGFGLLAGGDVFGQQPAGHRTVGQSPHAVPTGDVDPA
jgi:hypothetical protein